jgi:hypothetical protein
LKYKANLVKNFVSFSFSGSANMVGDPETSSDSEPVSCYLVVLLAKRRATATETPATARGAPNFFM